MSLLEECIKFIKENEKYFVNLIDDEHIDMICTFKELSCNSHILYKIKLFNKSMESKGDDTNDAYTIKKYVYIPAYNKGKNLCIKYYTRTIPIIQNYISKIDKEYVAKDLIPIDELIFYNPTDEELNYLDKF